MDSNRAAIFFDGGAKFFEGQLRVIARPRRFRHAGHAIRKKPREQNSGLYLRAGHRHVVVNGLEPGATDLQRREIIFASADVRAHFAKRADDALHGPLLERVIAGEPRGKLLSGENSRQKTHGGAGISGVERAPSAFQTTRPTASHSNGILVAFHFRAQRAHATQCAVAIGCRRKMAQFAGPFGERRQHRVTVRDGFISGQVQPAG